MARKARAYWKGHLRLSLVSLGVEIYNAVESQSDISFRQIHRPSGRRVQYEKVVQGVGKIDNADIVKGFEVEPDTYIILEPDEIESLKLESKKTIDLVRFVDAADIDYRYFERPYFITPSDPLGAEAYVVIRDALRQTGKVGLAQVTIAGREWLVGVAPLKDGLVMQLLRYAEELRDPADYFDDVPNVKPDIEMIELATQLIAKKSGPFEPASFEDHYQTALRKLVQDKRKGHTIIAPQEDDRPRGGNVVDLMDALRRSVGGDSAKARVSPDKTPAAPKKPVKAAASKKAKPPQGRKRA